MLSEFITETDVPIRTFAEMESINPDIAVCHDTVKVNEDALMGIIRGKFEMFAVPANARRKKTTGAASRIFFVKWTFDAPVVRNVEFAPFAIIECRRFCIRRISGKEPIVIHRNFVARIFGSIGCKHNEECDQQDGEHANHRAVVDFESSNSRRTQSYITPCDQLSA